MKRAPHLSFSSRNSKRNHVSCCHGKGWKFSSAFSIKFCWRLSCDCAWSQQQVPVHCTPLEVMRNTGASSWAFICQTFCLVQVLLLRRLRHVLDSEEIAPEFLFRTWSSSSSFNYYSHHLANHTTHPFRLCDYASKFVNNRPTVVYNNYSCSPEAGMFSLRLCRVQTHSPQTKPPMQVRLGP